MVLQSAFDLPNFTELSYVGHVQKGEEVTESWIEKVKDGISQFKDELMKSLPSVLGIAQGLITITGVARGTGLVVMLVTYWMLFLRSLGLVRATFWFGRL